MIMKSQFEDRKTLGTQLEETKEKHAFGEKIEVQCLIEEMGKSYMDELIKAAERKDMPNRYYIMVVWEKMPIEKSRTISFAFVLKKIIPAMEPETDVYYVDKSEGRLELLWSLPAYKNMDAILNSPWLYDKQSVESVKKYKELEKAAKQSKVS